MNSLKDFREALTIFEKYFKKGENESFFLEPAHDIIYISVGNDETSPEDTARLLELHWHQSEDCDTWAYFT